MIAYLVVIASLTAVFGLVPTALAMGWYLPTKAILIASSGAGMAGILTLGFMHKETEQNKEVERVAAIFTRNHHPIVDPEVSRSSSSLNISVF